MVVETRSRKNTQGPSADVAGPSTSAHTASSSISGSSVTSQGLAIQADYAAKVAALERSAMERDRMVMERERMVMEKERAALELQAQAQIAALQSSRSNRSSSRLSKKDISKWLDEAFDSCIPARNVDVLESPPDVTDPLTSVNVERSTLVPNGSVFVNSTRPKLPIRCVTTNPAYVGSARLSQPLPCTTAQNDVYQDTYAYDKSNTVPFNHNVVNPNLSYNNPHTYNINSNSSDIALLAQAITTLAGNAQPKPKVGDGRLPIFDGKPIDWLAFKRAFVNTSEFYTPSDNITRIGMALKGAAREAVAVLLVSARDPQEIISALEMRFGRSEFIILQEIASVRSLPKILSDSSDLHKFACRVRNCVEVIRLLGEHCYLESPELFQSVLSKLTPLLRTRWTDYGAVHFTPRQGKTKLELLAAFLAHEVDLQLKFGLHSEPVNLNKRVEKVHAVSFSKPTHSIPFKIKPENSKIICTFCKGNHIVDECDKFINLSSNDKWQFVIKNKLCHKCLKKGSHSYKFCKDSKEICTERDCFRRHHKLLHRTNSLVTHVFENLTINESSLPVIPENTEECSGQQTSDFVAHADSRQKTSCDRPLLKIIAVTVSGPKGSVDTYALLDDGSSSTFIDTEISSVIGAYGPKSIVQVNCLGGLSKSMEVEYVDFNIKGLFDNKEHSICRARAVTGLNITPQTLRSSDTSHFGDLRDHLCLSYENVRPMILLGIDNWHLILPQQVRKGLSNSQPVACLTALGWVVFGFTNSRTKTVDFVDSVNHGVTENFDSFIDLENCIRDHYKLDSIGITKRSVQSLADDRAISILENTTHRLPDGQFETGLLWRSDDLVIPESYSLALSRLLSLEKKFIKDETYAKHYRENINAMINKGYAELCNRQFSSGITWYLPHFGVTNPNKPGKLRVVHDAAAKCQGVSLNTLLLTGPDLLQSLFGILLRFCSSKIALTGDIREMFPQIKIRELDRDAQRFLWRDSQDLPISIYRMSSMMFGAASSPFTALYLKNKNAKELETQYPEAAQGIIINTYMDDFIASVDSVEEAALLARDVVTVHSQAHFVIRSWASNDEAALVYVPGDLRLNDTTAVDLSQSHQTVRTLGLIWHTKNDTLGFNFSNIDSSLPQKLSKRIVLSNMMRVFDPLGILAPLSIRARIIFQKVWRSGIDWDQELPRHLRVDWEQWTSDIMATLTLTIPRWYMTRPQPIEQELHVFCDASEEAYSTVAFWRFIFSDGDTQLSFISSRSRVAPLKPTSIPRLELQAALIAARLSSSILEASRIKPVRRFYWTDSMNVLGWLRNDARRYKPFVAHRVGEIIELTEIIEWRWVPGNLNVADDATRLKRGPLSPQSRWITGPSFLLSSDWPTEPTTNSPLLELKSSHHIHVHLINDENVSRPLSADPKRFSSWLRLLRATARAHQYMSTLRLKALLKKGISINMSCRVAGHLVTFLSCPVMANSRHNLDILSLRGTLSCDDLHLAKIHILRKSQQDSFSQELSCIMNNQPVPHRSRLSKLLGHIDKDNLLRLSSRIAAVTGVEEEVKSPIILDGKHTAVRLLILHNHHKAAHANTELVVNELRQHYWILSLRSSVRSVAYRCQVCQLRRASTTTPIMGQLPEARMSHHQRAFSFVGLDYFGPITVAVGRRREKRYVALYTCLTVRAVHFEVVFSLTTDAAIMALRRFIARRGTPKKIISDNGTAFVGASRVLRSLYGDAVTDFAACEMIQWKFLPPSAPFMAGATERLVKSAKTALKATLHSRSPTDEVLVTVLCEAEALINSRPLTHVSCHPDYPEALTPNHFLLGGYSSGQPFPAIVEDRDLCSRAGWRKALRLSDFFWQRWVKEYLPTLSPSRIRGEHSSWSVGDSVLVADGNLPRGSWPRGLVTALYPGKDGVTRVVDVTTSAGVLRRPIRKVIRLPV